MSEPIILIHRAQVYADSMPVRYGVELDVRLAAYGMAVLSHDPVGQDDFTAVGLWLAIDQTQFGVRPAYAWNLKEDGAERELADVLKDHPRVAAASFVFDGSYPTMRHARELGLRTAERLSDEERIATVGYVPDGRCIWLDRWNWDEPLAFALNGVTEGDIEGRCAWCPGQHEVWAASPELHVGKSPLAWLQHHWRIFFRLGVAGICTDHPVECEQAYAQWAKETLLSAGPA